MMPSKDKGRDALLDLIKKEQIEAGHVSEAFIAATAKSMGLSVGEVYGLATFYSFLSTKPTGKHVIRVCKSVPCCMQDAEIIIDSINTELAIDPGETTTDGRFSFELVNCIGACDLAPAMLINDKVYGHLTGEKISEILKSYD
jgi:NADH:ubiquinone oxidoreductase subunit E